ncbi:MAG: hypothetical protein IT373_18140 [Polyangiaceae bacterium]|nr:hypothetical protein [Polyangiaceae bacterium]
MTPTLDTAAHVGVEGRVDVSTSIGAPGANAFLQAGPGGGYNAELGGYFVFTALAGMQFGAIDDPDDPQPIRGRAAPTWSIRGGENGFRMGPGGLLELLVGVGRTTGPFGVFLVGPRLQVDGYLPEERGPHTPDFALERGAIFAPGFVATWMFGYFYGERRTPRVAPAPPAETPAPAPTPPLDPGNEP